MSVENKFAWWQSEHALRLKLPRTCPLPGAMARCSDETQEHSLAQELAEAEEEELGEEPRAGPKPIGMCRAEPGKSRVWSPMRNMQEASWTASAEAALAEEESLVL